MRTIMQTVKTRYHQAILTSCEIPWDENENLIEDLFRREVRHVLALGFSNVYVFGTAGEGYAVDTARFRRIVEVFREETQGEGVKAMVGAIGLSTANIVERYGVKLGPRCIPCQHNTLTFPDDSGAYYYS